MKDAAAFAYGASDGLDSNLSEIDESKAPRNISDELEQDSTSNSSDGDQYIFRFSGNVVIEKDQTSSCVL